MRKALTFLSLVMLLGCAQPTEVVDPRVEAIVDRQAVEDVVHELFVATDLKDWDRVRATFADDVVFDMTSMVGGEPLDMTPRAITEAWAEGLGPVQAVHHQVGNMVIEVGGDGADVHCYGTATHFKPDEEKRVTWFVGTYDLHLSRIKSRWRIDRFRFNAKYVE